MPKICRTVEKRDAETDRLKEIVPNTPELWNLVSNYNGGLTEEQVRVAFDTGFSVWTNFNRYVPIREEVSVRQAAWETAMGMRGYAGSPAQRADRKEGGL